MNATDITEGHPAYEAMDLGGGQCADLPGILRELAKAGYEIVKVEPEPKRKAREMRHAIDMIEGAMMGLGDFVELPRVFDGSPDELVLAPKMTVAQMRRVCTALEECTRIINSDDYTEFK